MVRLTEDEADAIICLRRMNEKGYAFEEVAAELGYELDRRR